MDESSRSAALIDAWRSTSGRSRPPLSATDVTGGTRSSRPTRARRRIAVAALAAAACAAVVLASLRWGLPAPATSETASPTTRAVTSTPTPTPEPATPVATTGPTTVPSPTPAAIRGPVYSAGFLDASFGWAYYEDATRRTAALGVTADGGRSWRDITPPDLPSLAQAWSIVFFDPEHGFVNVPWNGTQESPCERPTAAGPGRR